MPAVKVGDRTLAGIKRVAKREGITEDELAERWLREKLDDDMRRRMLEAAGANKPDPAIVHEATCAVTMFDMRVRISLDGRERGLWVWLRDSDPDRVRQHQALVRQDPDNPRFNGGDLEEGALLEWPTAKKFHAAMGKALRGRR